MNKKQGEVHMEAENTLTSLSNHKQNKTKRNKTKENTAMLEASEYLMPNYDTEQQ